MRRETDAAMQPDSMTVERGDALERVVAARMTIAGQIVRSAENAEDRRPRTRAQRFAKVVEKRHRFGPVQLVESGYGFSIDRHRPSWNNYDYIYHISRTCSTNEISSDSLADLLIPCWDIAPETAQEVTYCSKGLITAFSITAQVDLSS